MTQSNSNLFASFYHQFEKHYDKVALTCADGRRFTFADLDTSSARLSALLKSFGCESGQRVSVQVEKSPEALCLYLACLRAGLVFHPLNTGYKQHELSYFLSNAEPTIVVCDSADEQMMSALCSENNVPHLLTLNADGSGSLMDRQTDFEPDYSIAQKAPDDLASLLYSSGTTGVPKGIMLSHANLVSNGLSLVEHWGFTDQDVLLHALPIFHVHGLFVALSCAFLSGASMRWLKGFNLDEVMAELPNSSVMMGVPTYYTRLLSSQDFTAEYCSTMRLFISGSAPLLEETFYAFEARTGQRILERYGMSETNMNTSNPLHGERKAGTVGPALPGVEVRVVDDNGNVLPSGEIGNLQVRGENVFKGYWKLPEKTAEDFTADGFFNTGDKALIDSDNYVAIVGRAKDMVITGGLNVYPKEIELIIDELPGVKESAVIGVPHPDFGEGVVAVVVPKPGETPLESDMIVALRNMISSFKVPKRIVFRDELPRNTMGKVQKNILRAENKDLLTH